MAISTVNAKHLWCWKKLLWTDVEEGATDLEKRFMLWIEILLCLLLFGCGNKAGNERLPGESDVSLEINAAEADNAAQGKVAAVGNTDLQGADSAERILRKMELLQFEDPQNENLADLLQINGAGLMVQLEAGNILGSGVIYDEEGGILTILTAGHVLENAEGIIYITFCDGWTAPGNVYKCSEFGDFATISLELAGIPAEHAERYFCVNADKESFDAATAGDGCIVMGSRAGVAAEAYEGEILNDWIYMEDYGQYMMWVRAEGLPGMSGGGLFDQKGHFLGVLSGRNEEGELAVVPLSLILAELGG